MFDFSLFGSFLMDAANALQFGRSVSDLTTDDDTRTVGGARRVRALPAAERKTRAQRLGDMRRNKQSHSRAQSR